MTPRSTVKVKQPYVEVTVDTFPETRRILTAIGAEKFDLSVLAGTMSRRTGLIELSRSVSGGVEVYLVDLTRIKPHVNGATMAFSNRSSALVRDGFTQDGTTTYFNLDTGSRAVRLVGPFSSYDGGSGLK